MDKNQQIAIAQFINGFTNEDYAFGESVWDYFHELKYLRNERLSEDDYLKTLRTLPNEVKRAIVVKMMAALYIQIQNNDDYTWEQTFIALLDMQIGSGVEAALFNIILNAKKFLGEKAFVQLECSWREMDFSDYYSVKISIPMKEGHISIGTSSLRESPFVKVLFERSLIPNRSLSSNGSEANRLVEALTNEDITHQILGIYFNCDISLEHISNPFCDFYSVRFSDIEYEVDR